MMGPAPAIGSHGKSCAACSARTMGLCAPWSLDEIGMLSEIKGHPRVWPASTDLYRQGEPCPNYLVVVDGWIGTRVMLDDGSWHMPDFALPGALLGVQPLSGSAMTHSAVCLTAVTVCPLPRQRLDDLVASNPRLALRLAHLAACREARLQDHFVNVSGRGARERVAHLLMELFHRIRHRPPLNGDSVQLPLTLAQMGEALNLTDVHVSRMLAILRVQQVVRFHRHRLDILDAPAFTRAAGFGADNDLFDDEAPAATRRMAPRELLTRN